VDYDPSASELARYERKHQHQKMLAAKKMGLVNIFRRGGQEVIESFHQFEEDIKLTTARLDRIAALHPRVSSTRQNAANGPEDGTAAAGGSPAVSDPADATVGTAPKKNPFPGLANFPRGRMPVPSGRNFFAGGIGGNSKTFAFSDVDLGNFGSRTTSPPTTSVAAASSASFSYFSKFGRVGGSASGDNKELLPAEVETNGEGGTFVNVENENSDAKGGPKKKPFFNPFTKKAAKDDETTKDTADADKEEDSAVEEGAKKGTKFRNPFTRLGGSNADPEEESSHENKVPADEKETSVGENGNKNIFGSNKIEFRNPFKKTAAADGTATTPSTEEASSGQDETSGEANDKGEGTNENKMALMKKKLEFRNPFTKKEPILKAEAVDQDGAIHGESSAHDDSIDTDADSSPAIQDSSPGGYQAFNFGAISYAREPSPKQAEQDKDKKEGDGKTNMQTKLGLLGEKLRRKTQQPKGQNDAETAASNKTDPTQAIFEIGDEPLSEGESDGEEIVFVGD